MSFLRALRTVALPRAAISVPRSTALRYNALNLQRAWYSAPSSGLQKTEIEARVLDVLKSFEKVQGDKVCLNDSITLHEIPYETGRLRLHLVLRKTSGLTV